MLVLTILWKRISKITPGREEPRPRLCSNCGLEEIDNRSLSRIELHALYLVGAVPVTASDQDQSERLRFACFATPIDS